jgi:signal transduction histidine kinase
MRPLLLDTVENEALQALGRASVQIIHDLKNQLNGLKLYATFLRKRFENSDRPGDEVETVNKLIAGLERAAADLSTLVQYGRPIELKKQPGVDVHKMLRNVVSNLTQGSRSTAPLSAPLVVETDGASIIGEFDPVVLSEALKSISVAAVHLRQKQQDNEPLSILLHYDAASTAAFIEWRGLHALDHDPFVGFSGSDEIRMSLAAKIVEAHGGSAEHDGNVLRIKLPLQAQ